MKAARLIKTDAKYDLSVTDVDAPSLEAGKVLVEVHKAGVNPLDWKIKEGAMSPRDPVTLGEDFEGVVRDVGAGVSGLEPGDEIYGMAGFVNGASGSFAEYDLVDPQNVALRPKSVGEAEAGALPLTGVMALQAVTELFRLSPGEKILIHGGAGGIGSIAVQLARNLGAHVAVTCAADETDYVRSLGASEAIDYETQNFEEVISGYDAVYDLIGGEVYEKSFRVLKPGGTIVSTLEPPDEDLMSKYGVKAIYQHFQPTRKRLMKLAVLVDEGDIKVHVDKAFPLTETSEALRFQKEARPKGKIVIDVK